MAVAVAKPDTALAPPAPSQEHIVLPALRGDLVISRQMFEGRTYFVVKDPISLQYFRLTAEDYALATLFDGKRTFGVIRDLWIKDHPHLRLDYTDEETNERVLKFANDLALLQFLNVQGTRIKARMDARKQQKKKKGGLYELANKVFFYRRSLFDPDRVFGAMAKRVAWIWTKTTFWVSWAIIALGAVVFLTKAEGLDHALANLFNWHNIALMWVTTILIKSVHELGHGLTCKHFGGEVHEVGCMTMVFTPYFFVNVSDCWTMPDRRHRMLVSFAGIYVELVFAALATFLWAVVQPGWFKDFLFNIIIISSVSTLLFNANPLMRFDGYYIMIDAIETPNLQQKSRALVQNKVTKLLFGKGTKDEALSRMPLPKKNLALFYLYAVLSWLYGYYVIYKLIVFMEPHLTPLGLEGLTDWFAFLALTGWVVVPLWHFVQHLHLTRDDLKPGGRGPRIAKIFGIPFAAFLIFCFVPVQNEITRHSAVELAEPEIVHPDTPGFVTEVAVKEGQIVQPGTLLGRLENRELTERFLAAEQETKRYELAVNASIGLGKADDLRQYQPLLEASKAVLEKLRHDVQQLDLRAKTTGIIITRDMAQRVGHYLRPPQDAFCEIASLNPMLIKVPLSEREVRFVKAGNPVALMADAYPGQRFEGRVAADPVEMDSHNFPLAFSKERGGDVPTFHDAANGHEKLLEHTYAVTVEVQNPDNRLRYGMTMRAKIATGKRPFGKIALQWITDLISLDYRFSMSARHWFLFLIAPTLFAATPKATPPPKPPVAPVSKPSASPALAKDFFGPGTSLEVITLNDALQAALKNNLDAKVEAVGLRGEEARLRGAYGIFDPIFSFSATRSSTQSPDAVDNLRSADSIVRLEQVALATQVVNSGIAAFNSTQQGIANFLTQLESQLKNLADQGLISHSFSTINFTPIRAASITAPKGDDRSIIVFDQKTDQAEVELRARSPLGTIISISARANKLRSSFVGDTREVIPQYGASATVQARQPLLKDAGLNANLAEIRIGKKNREVQELTWRFRLENTLSSVVASYYDMQLGLADLGNKGDAITAGLQLLNHTQRRQQLGFLSPYEVQQSQVQLSFDRENLYLSKNFFLDKQYALQRLVLPEYDSTLRRVFVPAALPALQIPVLDRETLLALARANRLDYRAALATVEAEDIRVKYARNQRLPQLDIVGSYGQSGLDRSYSSAYSQAKSGQAPQWQIGIMGSVPIGNIQPRAQYDAALARKEQALLRAKATELEMGIGIERAIELIHTSQLRHDTSLLTIRAAQEAVRVGLGRLEEGMITNSDLLDQQRRLYDARTRELSALAELNKSITQLWLVTGTVLENLGITLADALPAASKKKPHLIGNGAQ